MDAVRRRIAGRQWTAGTRLPSVRSMAGAMAVSISTVVEAYGRLEAEGLLEARRGSGFYVAPALPALSLQDVGPRLDREVDPLWVARQSLQGGEALLKPGCGWLPAEWMPHESLGKALRAVARAQPAERADYADVHGHPGLRQLLARRLQDLAIAAAPGQIMLADSGTQALDLLCRLLLEPGDTVLVDDPCYFNFHSLLRAHRVQVVGVPYTREGPDLAAFEQALARHQPRLYLTNAALHNPTGASLSPAVAHRLLTLAARADLTLVEDGIFDDLEEAPSPRLAAYGGLARVVYIGSFSKTLSAAVRCGYIVARGDWIEALADLKVATAFSHARLGAETVYQLLKGGAYRRHVEGLRERLARTRAGVSTRLRALGLPPWIEPSGGMFLWCQLPDGVDGAALARDALARGVVLAPGQVFGSSPQTARFMRFNVAQCLDPGLEPTLAALLGQAQSGRPAPACAAGPVRRAG
ncbi:MAG: PLP-dependent aminotransferase family protein [Comamonas sp.]